MVRLGPPDLFISVPRIYQSRTQAVIAQTPSHTHLDHAFADAAVAAPPEAVQWEVELPHPINGGKVLLLPLLVSSSSGGGDGGGVGEGGGS